VAFEEIDIEQHTDGAQRVAEANRGNLTVPTMVFSDGTALTNPSASTVSKKIAALV
jgi:mycoredoxin